MQNIKEENTKDKIDNQKFRYIIPTNYNIKPKFLGIIDYKVLIIMIVFSIIVFKIMTFFSLNLIRKVQIILAVNVPVIISSVNLEEQNLIYIFKYFILYLFSPKLYLYFKDSDYYFLEI